MVVDNDHGVAQFIKDYPGMALMPTRGPSIIVVGEFSFSAHYQGSKSITETYDIEIIIPSTFPNDIPKVTEIGRIPKNGDFHVNPDGTICMGSPLRLLQKISKKPTLPGFAEECLVPYLYAVSLKLKNGGNFIFNELQHGNLGIVEDYKDLFELNNENQVVQALKILGEKKRIANKKLCPCGCGKRLGKCEYRFKLNKYRGLAKSSWFKEHAKEIAI